MTRILNIVVVLIVFCFVTSGSESFAQVIPNNSFDIWSTDGPYEIADNWTSSNAFTFDMDNTISLQSSNDANDGYYAANIATSQIGFAGAPYKGWLVLGQPTNITETGEVDFLTAGIPFVSTPETLTGYYKFNNELNPNDSATAIVYLKKFNQQTQSSELIGHCIKHLPISLDYTMFSLPIEYTNSNETPDSVVIAFQSSNTQPVIEGGNLLVDFLEFSTSLTNDDIETDGFIVYPNPSQSQITVEFPEYTGVLKINIYNMLGGLVKLNRAHAPSPTSIINVTDLEEGYYLLEIKQNENILHTAKVIISRS